MVWKRVGVGFSDTVKCRSGHIWSVEQESGPVQNVERLQNSTTRDKTSMTMSVKKKRMESSESTLLFTNFRPNPMHAATSLNVARSHSADELQTLLESIRGDSVSHSDQLEFLREVPPRSNLIRFSFCGMTWIWKKTPEPTQINDLSIRDLMTIPHPDSRASVFNLSISQEEMFRRLCTRSTDMVHKLSQ